MKQYRSFIALFAVLLLSLILVGCSVTVIFDPAGGTIVSGEGEQTVKKDIPAIPPEVERDGYVFLGWEGNYQTPEEDVTVKAQWHPLYTVSFDANGGVTMDESLLTQIIRGGEGAVLPEVVREGYEFDGWDTDVSVITADTTVTANWTRLYTVTYDPQGGRADDVSLLKQTVREGAEPTEPTVTKDKYVFVSWDKKVNDKRATITYTAKWERRVYDATEIHKLISPATVEVSTYRRSNIELALGSGFFIKDDGTLITNFHVIEEAYEIWIKTPDMNEYRVTHVIAYDREKDLAILKADVRGKKVPYLECAETTPEVGEVVYALGSSLGLTGTFSSGIVSYANRQLEGVSFVQSTAPISSGNSGGPLVNRYGQAIGVNTATYTEGQNLNLSVSVKEIKSLRSSDLTMSQFFAKEARIPYYIGELMIEEREQDGAAQEIFNGHTVKGSFKDSQDADLYLTKISSKDNYLMMAITADNPEDLEGLVAVIAIATADGLEDWDYTYTLKNTDLLQQKLVVGPNGRYTLYILLEIPEGGYPLGFVYYGAMLVHANGKKCNYQYFAYAMENDELFQNM